jgi:TPR repeat protein
MPAAADEMARQAVEAGSGIPELLMRHGDVLAQSDPSKALALYRKAAQADFAAPGIYMRLGKQFAALKQQPLADCCFRRAYAMATDREREEIRQRLGMPRLGPDLRPEP